MKTLKGRNHWSDRLARWALRTYRRRWVRYSAVLGLAVPPVFVTSFYSNEFFRNKIIGFAPFIGEILQGSVITVVVLAAAYPAIILETARGVIRRANTGLMTEDWFYPLNSALDRVVGCKERRFFDSVTKLNTLGKERAFCDITHPETQIGELVFAICEFFNAVREENAEFIDRGRLIRVLLAEIDDGQIVRVPVNYPEDDPKPGLIAITALNSPYSTIQTAIRKRRMVIVSSIASELRKPADSRIIVETGNRDDTTGSLICYPVFYNEKAVFVISVHCDEDGYFSDEKYDLYEHSLDRFGLRLRLEYSLLLMKEALCE